MDDRNLEAINTRRRSLGKRAINSQIVRQNPNMAGGPAMTDDFWVAYQMPGDPDQPLAPDPSRQDAVTEAALGVDGKQHVPTEVQQERLENKADPEGKTTGGGVDGNSKSRQLADGDKTDAKTDQTHKATDDKNDGRHANKK
jgi:hypothetical protein